MVYPTIEKLIHKNNKDEPSIYELQVVLEDSQSEETGHMVRVKSATLPFTKLLLTSKFDENKPLYRGTFDENKPFYIGIADKTKYKQNQIPKQDYVENYDVYEQKTQGGSKHKTRKQNRRRKRSKKTHAHRK